MYGRVIHILSSVSLPFEEAWLSSFSGGNGIAHLPDLLFIQLFSPHFTNLKGKNSRRGIFDPLKADYSCKKGSLSRETYRKH